MRFLVGVLLLLVISLPALGATNYVRYVNPNSTDAGCDGTSTATSNSGNNACAFASMNLAEAAGGGVGQPPLNLAAAGDSYTVYAHTNGSADTTAVVKQGWGETAGCYLTLAADNDCRSGTSWSNSKYSLNVGDVDGIKLNDATNYTRIDGLQVSVGSSAGDRQAIYTTNGMSVGDVRIYNCFATNTYSGSTRSGNVFYFNNSTGTVNLWNSIGIGYSTRNASSNASLMVTVTGTVNVYNSTFIGNRLGVARSTGTVNLYNIYSGGGTSSRYSGTLATKTACASSDTTGGTGLTSIAYSTSAGAYFSNVTAGSEDLSIGASSALINVGTDDPGSGLYSTDINGAARTSTWDIGADEYIVPPAGGWCPMLLQQEMMR